MEKTGNKRIYDKIRVGTRGSRLARRQTELLISAVQRAYPGIQCETVIIQTKGDQILNRPLQEFGGKGVFVTELEQLIAAGEIDCAVHSAKDMPMELARGQDIVCVLPRSDVRDVLITRKDRLVSREHKPLIGTGSLRRRAQIGRLYPHAQFCGIRGNIDTRLEKLRGGACDGIVLAAAGLARAGLDREADLSYTYFEPQDVIPAGGQAFIAVEGLRGHLDFWRRVGDGQAAQELAVERYVMQKLGAGCHEAVGVYAQIVSLQPTEGMEMPGCLMDKNIVLPEKRIRLSVMTEKDGQIYQNSGETKLRDWVVLADELSASLRKLRL